MGALGWIFTVLGILLFLILAILAGLFIYAFVRRDTPDPTAGAGWSAMNGWYPYRDQLQEGADWIRAQEKETLEMKSFDGLTLRGCYIPCEGATRCALLFHGYHGYPHTDFAPLMRFYHELGCNIFYADERAMNSSDGRIITFGVHESRDLFDWVKLVNERYPGQKLFLGGVSMGASTVLYATRFELPENLLGIVADCGFTSPYEIIKHVMRQNFPFLPLWLLVPEEWLCRLIGRFSMKDCDTRELLRNAKQPVLFIHGTDDDFVPTEMSREGFEACASPKKLVLIPGAGHACSAMQEPETVRSAIRGFLTEIGFLS